ncbi:preprotein translocase subunit SecG [Patescibacteria group bacterium]|nr:preprotein translocase subunit SecG [Patescibacteria group bacterium]
MILILQIIVSIILIVLVIIQERASGISGVFGGQGATPYQTRRGLEKSVFYLTIVFAAIFAGLAIANLL